MRLLGTPGKDYFVNCVTQLTNSLGVQGLGPSSVWCDTDERFVFSDEAAMVSKLHDPN